MARMPRPRKPYLQKEITRHGKTVWYFRRGKEKRIRIPGIYGSPEFNEAYDAAYQGEPVERRARAPKTSLRWLIDRYLESGRFSLRSEGTQRVYRSILGDVTKTAGDLNFKNVTKQDIVKGRVRREAKPFAAASYVSLMKVIFGFAVDNGWIETNPAEGIDNGKPQTDGHHTWTEEEVSAFQRFYPLGTSERLAMDILLYTGLRISDATRLGPQHIKDGVITFKTQKTGVEVCIPVLPPLAESIETTKVDGLLFLPAPNGKPRTQTAASMWFKSRAKKAGVSGTAHGLRKAGATFAAQNGATPYELAAMYGWTNIQMAERYTRKANKAALAKQAANKLYPHLEISAGNGSKKDDKSTG